MDTQKTWYESTTLGDCCCDNTHCEDCEENGNCDRCDTIDGRWVEAVSEYASSCDGCGELTHHCQFYNVSETGLGVCRLCFENGVVVSDE